MTQPTAKTLLCSCEDTMPLDPAAVARGTEGPVVSARHLCRSESAIFLREAAAGKVTVACTQEASRFRALAADAALEPELAFVNVREAAGWSSEGAASAPKMAALIAAAAVKAPPAPAVTFESTGVTLILGRGQVALDAAAQLANALDITVILTGEDDVAPPRDGEIPIRFGRVRTAKGHLGAFEITLDAYATPLASSRSTLVAGTVRAGAVSKCDVVIDLTGKPALFPAHELREGYLRADPGDAAAVQRILFKALDLDGTFDKPRSVTYRADLCAHKRSKITGCTRCLDVCPAGAITPDGNAVAIDPHICGGCGACAAVCPTGAAEYAVPTTDVVMQRVRAALVAYAKAGGDTPPVLLFHDEGHGLDLIFAASRFGDGLPAHVIPLALTETTQLGLEVCAAALAYGATGVAVLTRARPKHDIASLRGTLSTANRVAAGLGYGDDVCRTIETDDPDALAASLREPLAATPTQKPARFMPLGGKRAVLTLALREMHRAAPTPVETIAVPVGAAFGAVHVATDGCTLCLACVSACPPHALTANDDKPQLKFDESLCVQCGLCAATCPENVITLEPRVNFAAFEAGPVIVKEEEPFCCTRCAKPFGVKSTVERVVAKLKDQHWMFAGDNAGRLDLITMCDTCRVEMMTNEKFDPYARTPRKGPKTSEDYIREREAAMLAKIKSGEA